MKKLAFLFLLVTTLHARAGLVIVQNVDSHGASHNVTVTIQDNKFRTDIADQLSSITNLANGDTITLIHARKAFMKMTGSQMHEMIEAKMQAALHGDTAPTAADVPKITDTGKTEKIDGHTAEIYTATTKLMTFTYWVTKDYPDYAAVKAQMDKFNALKSALSEKMSAQNYLLPDTTKLDGVVLKTEMVDTQGTTSKMTLISAKAQPIDDKSFLVPADYMEAQAPGAPPAAPAAPIAPAASGPAAPAPAAQ